MKENNIYICLNTCSTTTKVYICNVFLKYKQYLDFLMSKSAQNIIGSVMCCPGCFSLYRFEALHDCIDTYSMPTSSASEVLTKDNGTLSSKKIMTKSLSFCIWNGISEDSREQLILIFVIIRQMIEKKWSYCNLILVI